MIIKRTGNTVNIYPHANENTGPEPGKWASRVEIDTAQEWPIGFLHGRWTVGETEQIANALLEAVKIAKEAQD